MTSLRTIEGTHLEFIHTNYGKAAADTIFADAQKYIRNGKMEFSNGALILTPEGRFFADGIAADLFR